MTYDKTCINNQKPRKQHTPEFRRDALKLAERIGVAAAAHELRLYVSSTGIGKSAETGCLLQRTESEMGW